MSCNSLEVLELEYDSDTAFRKKKDQESQDTDLLDVEGLQLKNLKKLKILGFVKNLPTIEDYIRYIGEAQTKFEF